MRLPDDKTKYSHNWKYYEAGIYVEELDQVIRQGRGKKGNRTPIIYTVDELDKLVQQKGNVGVYTSVYAYNSKDLDQATRFAPLFFDLDSADLSESVDDARKLIAFFNNIIREDAIRLYFSGNKGFHIEIEPLALGINPAKDLKSVFRKIAEDLIEELSLTTVDLRVYDHRRMWRKPHTIHQKTGLWKTFVPQTMLFSDEAASLILEWAKEDHIEDVPEQKIDIEAASWYREYVYSLEKEEQMKDLSIHERFNLLNKQGSSIIHTFNDADMEFDPLRGFEGCPSIMRLWKKAEETGNLDHEERLFLCSLLTYSQEAIDYLYAILKNCKDFDPDRSKHHIDDWIARREAGIGGRPYTCRTANEKGVGCGNCHLEPRKKYKTVGSVTIETGEVAEPSPVRLLYRRKKKYNVR